MRLMSVAWCALGTVVLAYTASAERVPGPGTKLKTLCSTDLSRAYVLACYGVSSSEGPGKRSLMPMPALYALTSMYEDTNEVEHEDWPNWPWLEARRAHNRLLGRHYGKRNEMDSQGGLADECCIKSCYIEELLSYCP